MPGSASSRRSPPTPTYADWNDANPETGRGNLIYDRYDGHHGLIGSAD
jgi:hypothetical protein